MYWIHGEGKQLIMDKPMCNAPVWGGGILPQEFYASEVVFSGFWGPVITIMKSNKTWRGRNPSVPISPPNPFHLKLQYHSMLPIILNALD